MLFCSGRYFLMTDLYLQNMSALSCRWYTSWLVEGREGSTEVRPIWSSFFSPCHYDRNELGVDCTLMVSSQSSSLLLVCVFSGSVCVWWQRWSGSGGQVAAPPGCRVGCEKTSAVRGRLIQPQGGQCLTVFFSRISWVLPGHRWGLMLGIGFCANGKKSLVSFMFLNVDLFGDLKASAAMGPLWICHGGLPSAW